MSKDINYLTARQIGKQVGLTAREVNLYLAQLGFLAGKPGDWNITKQGKLFSTVVDKDNGYGGYAARSCSFIKWDDAIIVLIARLIDKKG